MIFLQVEVVPHAEQRYNTVGDWIPGRPEEGIPHRIIVSNTGSPNADVGCALHELVEFWLCHQRGISEESVSAFDVAFEGEDPGADPEAPYHQEHMTATAIEHCFVAAMGLSIAEYNRSWDNLEPKDD